MNINVMEYFSIAKKASIEWQIGKFKSKIKI